MCGRYILVQKMEKMEERFNAKADKNIDYKPSYNISPGKKALIITSEQPDIIQSAIFGLTPFWADKSMYLFNARAEGDKNKENSPEYKGSKDIINKPAFRKPIRSQRCLVIADAFIEGTTQDGLSKPYLIFLRNKQRPFAFAGIYDDWKNPKTGEIIRGFAIITTSANDFIRMLPHHRCPLILPKSKEKIWIRKNLALTDVTDMLNPPDPNIFNAYPISSAIKNPNLDFPELINPIGEPLIKEEELKASETLLKQGFGKNNRRF